VRAEGAQNLKNIFKIQSGAFFIFKKNRPFSFQKFLFLLSKIALF